MKEKNNSNPSEQEKPSLINDSIISLVDVHIAHYRTELNDAVKASKKKEEKNFQCVFY